MSDTNTNEPKNESAIGSKFLLKEFYCHKMGCTQFFDPDGTRIGVTVLKKIPSVVLSKGTSKNKVRVAYSPVEKSKLNKTQIGQFKNLDNGYKFIMELEPTQQQDVPQPMEADIQLVEKEKVCAQGTSKGKGFQGVLKRWHFAGMHASHGAGPTHRSPGSIGMRTSPGRVFKNKKLAGHMGDETKHSKNLVVAKIQDDLVFVIGSVPGSRGSLVKLIKV